MGSVTRADVPIGANPNGDTIAAIATAVAAGAGSVAIVRLSGPAAEAIGRRLFTAPGGQPWESHRVLYGHVVDPADGRRVDEALLLLMRAPRSFTREDVVELHCHGGLVAVRRVLELVLAAGARLAGAGEFSQRAFLNGRLDLTRAEAIAEMVTARSHRAAELAMAGIDGGLQRRIAGLRERLLDQLAELEARVDFEEDLPRLDGTAVRAELLAVRGELEQLVADSRQGELLREGLRVAIVGRPNVGKSSLLNLLSRRERAIVTDLPGTTRDLLESDLVLDGVPLTLLDTAGIRPTDDRVELLGIERSHQALAAADAVLLLFDLVAGWTASDQALRALVPKGVPLLLVGNKRDALPDGGAPAEATALQPDAPVVAISALTGEGRDGLVAALLGRCGASELQGLQVALNGRQRELAVAAAASLERSLEAADQGLPWDFWTIDLRGAIAGLGAITGEEVSEAVLDRIFSRFCIGK
ncbi:tRNA uridine-5-carboxymethylaminomethyl(34) synthesis GTPase MnmE [Synechococcus sp. BA-132 BA5]|uniref:tRNA uridine-5-carboxymethylaminomethyl(34) synthesis GTPase MnmE n=1 Tax=Synechococcus sp. BA-132 BA5 TaxID=3110252 RepID=UPI002B20B104|nr:tRNA uridine-5-carboxymethylaminomethyl(34) synthesis GTPase MnmE [Synechococcus sp. BA-132 BA5]MEA5416836.1 tRNA uridine-5-carboxymethylaminomethyl(34) synthesis GTPase MnmE [Synechococcus sp. BA-132 BA5]